MTFKFFRTLCRTKIFKNSSQEGKADTLSILGISIKNIESVLWPFLRFYLAVYQTIYFQKLEPS